jgi:hypothetical protein
MLPGAVPIINSSTLGIIYDAYASTTCAWGEEMTDRFVINS